MRITMCGSDYKRLMNSPAEKNEAYQPTTVEQIANIVTHGVFIIPAVIAFFTLHVLATPKSSSHKFIGWVYGTALIVQFSVSTTFHVVCLTGKYRSLRFFLHLCDRGVIYFFIAASYTPWLLLRPDIRHVGETMSWSLWFLAALGTIYNFMLYEKYKTLETILYLMIGILPSVPMVMASADSSALLELAIGGAFFVSGVPFFKSDGRLPFAHAIWHLFCATGAWCHFYAVYAHLY